MEVMGKEGEKIGREGRRGDRGEVGGRVEKKGEGER